MFNQAHNTYESDLRSMRRAPDDVLRQVSKVLIGAKRYSDLYQLLLGNPAYLTAKFERFGTHSFFLEEIGLALKTLEAIPQSYRITVMIALVTARHVVSDRLSSVTDIDLESLVWLSRVDEAISYARLRTDIESRFGGLLTIYRSLVLRQQPYPDILVELYEITATVQNLTRKTEFLLQIAEEAHDINLDDIAEDAFRQATDTISQIDESQVSRHVTTTNRGTVLVGWDGDPNNPPKLPEVKWIDLLEQEAKEKEFLTARLLTNLIHSGRIAIVQERLALLGDPGSKVEILCLIYKFQATKDAPVFESELLDQAYRLTQSIIDPSYRTLCFCHMLSAISSGGNSLTPSYILEYIKSGIESIKSAGMDFAELAGKFHIGRSENVDRVHAITAVQNMAFIARYLAQLGYLSESKQIISTARHTLENIPEGEEYLFEEVPIFYNELYFENSLVRADAYYGRHDDALGSIALALAEAHEIDEALAITNNLKHEVVASVTRYKLGLIFINQQHYEQAIQIALSLPQLPLFHTQYGLNFIFQTRYSAHVYRNRLSEFNTQTHLMQTIVESLVRNNNTVLVEQFLSDFKKLPFGAAHMRHIAANQHDHINQYRKATLLTVKRAFAKALAQTAQLNEAEREFALIAKELETSTDVEKTTVLNIQLLEYYATHGRIDIAKRLVHYVRKSPLILEAHRIIGEELAKDEDHLEEGLKRVGIKAKASLHSQPDDSLRAMSLGILAKALNRMKLTSMAMSFLQEAVSICDNIDNPAIQAWTWSNLAWTTYQVIDSKAVDVVFSASLQKTRGIFPRWNQIPVLITIADDMVKANRKEWAKEVFEVIKMEIGVRYPQTHKSSVGPFVDLLIRHKEYDLAVSMASTMVDNPMFAADQDFQVFSSIALSLAAEKRYSEAANILMTVKNHEFFVKSISRMAITMFYNGDTELATKSISLARSACLRIKDISSLDEASTDILIATGIVEQRELTDAELVELGSKEKSIEVLNSIGFDRIQHGNLIQGLPLLRLKSADDFLMFLLTHVRYLEQNPNDGFATQIENSLYIMAWYNNYWKTILEKIQDTSR